MDTIGTIVFDLDPQQIVNDVEIVVAEYGCFTARSYYQYQDGGEVILEASGRTPQRAVGYLLKLLGDTILGEYKPNA